MDNVSEPKPSDKPEQPSPSDKPGDGLAYTDVMLSGGGSDVPMVSPEAAKGIVRVGESIVKGVVKEAVGTPSNALGTASSAAQSYLAWEIPVAIVGEAAAGTIMLTVAAGVALNKSLEFTAGVLHSGAKMLVTGHGGEIPGAIKDYYEQKKDALVGKINPALDAMATVYKSAYENKPNDPDLQKANAKLESIGGGIAPSLAGLIGGGASMGITRGALGRAAIEQAGQKASALQASIAGSQTASVITDGAKNVVASVKDTLIKNTLPPDARQPVLVTPGLGTTPHPVGADLTKPPASQVVTDAKDTAVRAQGDHTSDKGGNGEGTAYRPDTTVIHSGVASYLRRGDIEYLKRYLDLYPLADEDLAAPEIREAAKSALTKQISQGDLRNVSELLDLKLLADEDLAAPEIQNAVRAKFVDLLSRKPDRWYSQDLNLINVKKLLALKLLPREDLAISEIQDAGKAKLVSCINGHHDIFTQDLLDLNLLTSESLAAPEIHEVAKFRLTKSLSEIQEFNAVDAMKRFPFFSLLTEQEVHESASLALVDSLSRGATGNALNLIKSNNLLRDEDRATPELRDAAKLGYAHLLSEGHRDSVERLGVMLDFRLLEYEDLAAPQIHEAAKSGLANLLSQGDIYHAGDLLYYQPLTELEIRDAARTGITKALSQGDIDAAKDILNFKSLEQNEIDDTLQQAVQEGPATSAVRLALDRGMNLDTILKRYANIPELTDESALKLIDTMKKSDPAWSDVQNVQAPFDSGAQVFGAARMLRYAFKASGSLGDSLAIFKYLNDASDPSVIQHLLTLEKQGLNIEELCHFIQENPGEHSALVSKLVEKNATVEQLGYDRLQALVQLSNHFSYGSSEMHRILELEQQGLSLAKLSDFIAQDPIDNALLVKTKIDQGASIQALDPKCLAAEKELVELQVLGFDSTTMDKVHQLQSKGLSTGRLVAYLTDGYRAHTAIRLIQEGANVQQLNNWMSLGVLPGDVASKLSQPGYTNVPQVLGYLRNWQAGRYFRDGLIEHVDNLVEHAGKDLQLSEEQLREIMSRSQITAQDKLTLHEHDGDKLLRQIESRTGGNRFEQAFRAAEALLEASQNILRTVPTDRTIVVLGRDAWPLVPILRSEGRDNVQYFMWSRLQSGDETTAKQWLKEVPPNSVVVDTGYSGSIIDSIRQIDPTASGYLMSSDNSEYPQLLAVANQSGIINDIEYYPKLISRSQGFTEQGGAVSRRNTRDSYDHDEDTTDQNRWYTELANRHLLRAAGLPEWDIWRYSNWVGLTPRERLGLDTRQQLEAHYEEVKRLREALSSQPHVANSD